MKHEAKLVVVTGGAGYLGSVLVPMLLEAGYRVRVIDRFFFGRETLRGVDSAHCELVEADTRWCPEELFEGAYAVMDLAALSNDPAGELNRERTLDINFHARVRTARIAKKMNVARYVLASSCSVYGFNDEMVDENTEPAPITTYAEASLRAEQGVLPLSDDTFSVTVLRQGTLYGLSPRMRFDLVVNVMTRTLAREKTVTIRGGLQWRPLVHVADSARAFLAVLESPRETVAGETFNVGSTEHNFRVEDIAQHVLDGSGLAGSLVPERTAVDTRSYRVSSNKIARELSYSPRFHPRDGAGEIARALLGAEIADGPRTSTIEWYKTLLAQDSEVLDREFDSARQLNLESDA